METRRADKETKQEIVQRFRHHTTAEGWPFRSTLQLTAVRNLAFFLGLVIVIGGRTLDFLNDIQPFDHLAKDHMLAIKMGSLHGADEELRAVRVGSSIRHGQDSGTRVFQLEVLILKFTTIDGLATRPVKIREVSALDHELRNHAVEDGALEGEGLFRDLSLSLLTSAQSAKVLSRLWNDVFEQFHHDTASCSTADGDLEEDFRV